MYSICIYVDIAINLQQRSLLAFIPSKRSGGMDILLGVACLLQLLQYPPPLCGRGSRIGQAVGYGQRRIPVMDFLRPLRRLSSRRGGYLPITAGPT